MSRVNVSIYNHIYTHVIYTKKGIQDAMQLSRLESVYPQPNP